MTKAEEERAAFVVSLRLSTVAKRTKFKTIALICNFVWSELPGQVPV